MEDGEEEGKDGGEEWVHSSAWIEVVDGTGGCLSNV